MSMLQTNLFHSLDLSLKKSTSFNFIVYIYILDYIIGYSKAPKITHIFFKGRSGRFSWVFFPSFSHPQKRHLSMAKD